MHSIGQISLIYTDKVEDYQIGKGRFSLTKLDENYQINFWIRAEYDIAMPDGQKEIVWGPTMEILTVHNSEIEIGKVSLLQILNREKAGEEWDIKYRTGFYHQSHQTINNCIFKVQKLENEHIEIEFTGEPSDDSEEFFFKGNCILPLSDSLERYW
ncbi:hypothetical protein [Flammeovirga sp. SJP92]|uniref:hypothetical protein n=1 Tax=Flammeovirga sp. SJP92 TaxID=1775430 RepID=UPI00079B1137|nr:hypothetical protein [Flammeovirga sp. SJP92]KXX66803.1 hypothetical protein AVL50_30180 [Flammeovirga sp. SJP92]